MPGAELLAYDPSGLWQEMPLAFFDLEATGIDTAQARIVEVGIVTYREGRLAERWGQLVNPGMPIPEEASQVNKITDEMVADEPAFRDVVWEIYRRLRDKVLVAYNGIWYDHPLLTAEMARCGLTPPLQPVLDPMMWVFKNMPSKSGWPFGQERACDKLGIALTDAHRAVADCEALAQLTLRIGEQVPPTLGDLLTVQEQWLGEFQELKAAREAKRAAKQAAAAPPDEPESDAGQGGLF